MRKHLVRSGWVGWIALLYSVLLPAQYDPLPLLPREAAGMTAEECFDQGYSLYQSRQNALAATWMDHTAQLARPARKWDLYANARLRKGILLNRMGRYDEAALSYRQGLYAANHFLPPDHEVTAKIYHSMGGAYSRDRRYQKALLAWQLEIDQLLSITPVDTSEVMKTYNNLGNLCDKIGDLDQSYIFFNSGIAYDPQGKSFNQELATLQTNFGVILGKTGENERATQTFDAAIETRRGVSPQHPKYYRLGATYVNKAAFLNDAGRSADAILLLEQAIQLFKDYPPAHPYWLSDTYISMAEAYESYGNPDSARTYYQKALPILMATSGFYDRHTAQAQYSIGAFFLREDQLDSARFYCDRALQSLFRNWKPAPGKPLPHPDTLYADPRVMLALMHKGDAWMAYFDSTRDETALRTAHQSYLLATREIDLIRNSFRSEVAKRNLTGRTYTLYERAIHSALELAELTDSSAYRETAFQLAEKGKGSSLLLQLHSRAALRNTPPVIRSAFNFYQAKVEYLENYRSQLRQGGALPSQLAIVNERLIQLQRQYERYKNLLGRQYPYLIQELASKPVSLRTVQKELLQEGDLMLEYFKGENRLVIMAITPTQFEVIERELSPTIDPTLDSLNSWLSRMPSGSIAEKKDFSQASRELYLQLLAPVLDTGSPLHNLSSVQRLILLPDEDLTALPFEVLLTEEIDPAKTNYRQLPYLVRNYPIQYAYSATVYAENLNQPAAAPHNGKNAHFGSVLSGGITFSHPKQNPSPSEPIRKRPRANCCDLQIRTVF